MGTTKLDQLLPEVFTMIADKLLVRKLYVMSWSSSALKRFCKRHLYLAAELYDETSVGYLHELQSMTLIFSLLCGRWV